MRIAWLVVAACASFSGPHANEVVGKLARATWRQPVSAAVIRGSVVEIEFGNRVVLRIPSCYAHAESRLGDHDKFEVELDHVAASEGALDITDCTTKHVIATVRAKFPDGQHVEASIDTALSRP